LFLGYKYESPPYWRIYCKDHEERVLTQQLKENFNRRIQQLSKFSKTVVGIMKLRELNSEEKPDSNLVPEVIKIPVSLNIKPRTKPRKIRDRSKQQSNIEQAEQQSEMTRTQKRQRASTSRPRGLSGRFISKQPRSSYRRPEEPEESEQRAEEGGSRRRHRPKGRQIQPLLDGVGVVADTPRTIRTEHEAVASDAINASQTFDPTLFTQVQKKPHRSRPIAVQKVIRRFKNSEKVQRTSAELQPIVESLIDQPEKDPLGKRKRPNMRDIPADLLRISDGSRRMLLANKSDLDELLRLKDPPCPQITEKHIGRKDRRQRLEDLRFQSQMMKIHMMQDLESNFWKIVS
jgi:hypothetical protein